MLVFPATTLQFRVGDPVEVSPTVDGAAAPFVFFAIAPDLPAGLTLDELDGTVYGVPEAAAARVEYTVTGEHDPGYGPNESATLRFVVNSDEVCCAERGGIGTTGRGCSRRCGGGASSLFLADPSFIKKPRRPNGGRCDRIIEQPWGRACGLRPASDGQNCTAPGYTDQTGRTLCEPFRRHIYRPPGPEPGAGVHPRQVTATYKTPLMRPARSTCPW